MSVHSPGAESPARDGLLTTLRNNSLSIGNDDKSGGVCPADMTHKCRQDEEMASLRKNRQKLGSKFRDLQLAGAETFFSPKLHHCMLAPTSAPG
jgi:hypothetical protein